LVRFRTVYETGKIMIVSGATQFAALSLLALPRLRRNPVVTRQG
jgi:hypothetical protein